MTPQTTVGRVVGAICAVTGTLVIALPVPIVSENFSLFYKQERRRRMVQERRAVYWYGCILPQLCILLLLIASWLPSSG